MQNPHFGSKIKTPKYMSKSILQIIYNCSVQKIPPKKTLNILDLDHCEYRQSCKGYSPCKTHTLGQELKFRKRCQNPFYKSFRVVLWEKTAPKKTEYSRNKTILKIGHHAKAIAHEKC